jgi:hypothetical protein
MIGLLMSKSAPSEPMTSGFLSFGLDKALVWEVFVKGTEFMRTPLEPFTLILQQCISSDSLGVRPRLHFAFFHTYVCHSLI